MTATCVLWVRVCLNSEPLFSILDGLRSDTRRRYWISENVTQGNTCGMGENMRPKVTEIKIALQMSHKHLTTIEEYIK